MRGAARLHCVRLAGPRLAVGEDGAVVTLRMGVENAAETLFVQ